jgi:DNA-binding transcriptional ArsR family regulator
MAYDYGGVAALADPTRRSVFELVAKEPRSVADLTRALTVTQSAVSQHLKVLKGAQLVRSETRGRRSIYRLDPRGLHKMRQWLDGMWDEALASFAHELEQSEGED